MNRLLHWLVESYDYIFGENPRTAEGRALFADRLVELIMGATALGVVAYNSLGSHRPVLANTLLIAVAVRFWSSRTSVGQELKISAGLYPEGHIPDDMAQESHWRIFLQIAVFVGAYMVLGITTGNILISSFLLSVISCFDYRTRIIIRHNVLKSFSNGAYLPLKSDMNYSVIMNNRAVARWYLCELPTRAKEGLSIFGCLLAFGLSVYSYTANNNFDVAAYLVLIGTLVTNEFVAHRWRIMRYRRLRR